MMKPTDEITEDDVESRFVVALEGNETTNYFVSPSTVCSYAVDASPLTRQEAEDVAEHYEGEKGRDPRVVPVEVACMFIVSIDGDDTFRRSELLD